MDKKSKITILIGVLCMTICFIIAGSSYAYFKVTKTQSAANVASSGCFAITMTEGDAINITSALPISDEDGLKQSPFTFTIKNTCDLDATYQVQLETLNASTLDISHVKSNLTETKLVSAYSSVTPYLTDAKDSRVIATGNLKSGASKTYDLRLWMDKDTSLADGQNKSYSAKIVVVNTAVSEFPPFADASGAATPVLPSGMVPILYNDSKEPVVADITEKWYDYGAHEWANAVLVDSDTYRNAAPGTVIPEDYILQYYVWIPRYRYLLWNAENGSSEPQMIDIKFEDKTTPKSTGSTNGTWLTHPAFTFGGEELNGIWVGKFENSTSDPTCQGENETYDNCNLSTLPVSIKPNQSSWVLTNISNAFAAIQGIGTTNASLFGLTSSEVDTHMMKNMDWGAVAYLSSSIYGRYTSVSTCIDSGCQVWINNVINNSSNWASTTGCAGASVSASSTTLETCPSGYDWTASGVNASTTGNQYGIYDMSGGSFEYVMGNMVDSLGNFYSQSSGFVTAPEVKYYNSYAYGDDYYDFSRGSLGDATKETIKKFGSDNGGWYGNFTSFPSSVYPWLIRGGDVSLGSGLFFFGSPCGDMCNPDADYVAYSSRSVLTNQ